MRFKKFLLAYFERAEPVTCRRSREASDLGWQIKKWTKKTCHTVAAAVPPLFTFQIWKKIRFFHKNLTIFKFSWFSNFEKKKNWWCHKFHSRKILLCQIFYLTSLGPVSFNYLELLEKRKIYNQSKICFQKIRKCRIHEIKTRRSRTGSRK